mmetsp:Transcript_28148/g.68457  ORF Transcript_28148/g.68457 Transcript_28148/m.68457 type:complete len:170 (-) Transcript_28148:1586-2095(-)
MKHCLNCGLSNFSDCTVCESCGAELRTHSIPAGDAVNLAFDHQNEKDAEAKLEMANEFMKHQGEVALKMVERKLLGNKSKQRNRPDKLNDLLFRMKKEREGGKKMTHSEKSEVETESLGDITREPSAPAHEALTLPAVDDAAPSAPLYEANDDEKTIGSERLYPVLKSF